MYRSAGNCCPYINCIAIHRWKNTCHKTSKKLNKFHLIWPGVNQCAVYAEQLVGGGRGLKQALSKMGKWVNAWSPLNGLTKST